MLKKYLSEDVADLGFRALFCTIFLGLGMEHLFADDLIRLLMPEWMPMQRVVSVISGLILVFGGSLIFIGYRLRLAASVLAIFILVVTFTVHVPGVFMAPVDIPQESLWMWDILQRSNLVKNLCLLGVCLLLFYYEPKKYSYEGMQRNSL